MPGIKAIGAYVPFYRLCREEIARAWGGGGRGEKAVANFDEDSITLGVEAARDCLQGIDRRQVGGLYFATTTAPYREKQASALMATALDLPRDAVTADFTDSLRSATVAVRAALDTVRAGSLDNVLVVAAECRLGVPGSEYEQAFGDGAAAVLISSAGPVELTGLYTHTDEILDNWRTADQKFVRTWEDRFVITQGFLANVQEAVGKSLARFGASLADFQRVVLAAPDTRRYQEACRLLGLKSGQLTDPLCDTVGNTSTAHGLLMLVAALAEAAPGDRLLTVNYGDGCDVFSLEVKEQWSPPPGWRGVKGYLQSKQILNSYEKYVRLRDLMLVETGRRRPPLVSSAAVLHRDRRMVLALHASQCTNCGRMFFPPQRVCLYCRAKDQYTEVSIAEQKGTLFTFCKDALAQSVDPPVVISIVDLEGGLRFYGQMTDRDPEQVKLDMPVELTFRRLSEAEGFYNYFWKCRPLREERGGSHAGGCHQG